MFKCSSEIEAARRSCNDILLEKVIGKIVTFDVELGGRSAWVRDGSADKFQVVIEEILMDEGGVDLNSPLREPIYSSAGIYGGTRITDH